MVRTGPAVVRASSSLGGTELGAGEDEEARREVIGIAPTVIHSCKDRQTRARYRSRRWAEDERRGTGWVLADTVAAASYLSRIVLRPMGVVAFSIIAGESVSWSI